MVRSELFKPEKLRGGPMLTAVDIDIPASIADWAIAAGLGSTVGFIGTRVERVRGRLTAQSIWGLQSPAAVTIAVAHSGSPDTGDYERPVTGIGQVRALAALMPSLMRAYKDLDVDKIRLSSEPLASRRSGDVIAIGGPKNNEVTADFLELLVESTGIEMTNNEIIWRGDDTFGATVRDGNVVDDVGLLVRARNPYSPAHRVILIAGVHTYGTVAAAEYLVSRKARRRFRERDFAAVVKTKVRDGHSSDPMVLEELETSGDQK